MTTLRRYRSITATLHDVSRVGRLYRNPSKREIPIESNPFTAELDGQSSKIRVRYQVAPDFGVQIQSCQYLLMLGPRADWNTLGLDSEHVCELQCLVRRTRADENARMGDDAEESTQYQIRDSEGLVPAKHGLKPRPAEACSEASSRYAATRTLTSGRIMSLFNEIKQRGRIDQIHTGHNSVPGTEAGQRQVAPLRDIGTETRGERPE